jgi:hypothetical protein
VLFGLVESRSAGPGGQAMLELGVRRLEAENLCADRADNSTCRVTVSDKDFGVVWVLVSLHGDDDVGPRAVAARSLLRVVGTLGDDVSSADGAPIVHGEYYRHFPPDSYVTRSGAGPKHASGERSVDAK